MQQLQVMANGRLFGMQHAAESRNVHFAFIGQCQHESQARFVGQKLEDLG
jgi:hypothetical protein